MANIVVTTDNDTVDAGDGQTSLREAVAMAQSGDTIILRPGGASSFSIDLSSPLEISGKAITIEGSDHHLLSNNGEIAGQIVVDAGASLTLRYAEIVNLTLESVRGTTGEDGEQGDAGTTGLPGTSGTQPGTNGGHADAGGDGTMDPLGAGASAIGAIVNNGTLVLDHVLVNGEAHAAGGDDGGSGGEGGAGGDGGEGHYDTDSRTAGAGGSGGDGGDGGGGAAGTAGGSAVGGIYNHGSLTLIDSVIYGYAEGGEGGAGGDGGAGGGGGEGGDGGNGGHGGNAGSGGNGGDGGAGGGAVGGLLNDGSITVVGAASVNGEAVGGDGGDAGDGGDGADAGKGGAVLGSTGTPGLAGNDGNDGAGGIGGIAGLENDGLQNNGSLVGTIGEDKHFYEFYSTNTGQSVAGQTASTTFTLQVNQNGFGFSEGTLGWRVVVTGGSLSLSDFSGATSGTLTWGGHGYAQNFTVELKAGAAVSTDTAFSVEIFDPSNGDLLGTENTSTVHLFAVTNNADKVKGSAGEDTIDAGGGNDTITGGKGDDSIIGGAGIDTVVFSGKASDYTITHPFTGYVEVQDNRLTDDNEGTDTLQQVEKLKFADKTITVANDTAPTNLALSNTAIAENASLGSVVGLLSAKDAEGDAITWSLSGGDGLFTLLTKNGKTDVMVNGPLDFETAATHDITVTASDGSLTTSKSFTIDVTDVLETIKGNNKPNVISGGIGADRILGLGGDDTLKGKDGDDILVGGTGVDSLYGNGGHDTFQFATGDSGKTKDSADTIFDFTHGDKVDISQIDAIAGTKKNDAFSFIGNQDFDGTAGELRYDAGKKDTWISGDVDGDGKADFMIHLHGDITLGKGDFHL